MIDNDKKGVPKDAESFTFPPSEDEFPEDHERFLNVNEIAAAAGLPPVIKPERPDRPTVIVKLDGFRSSTGNVANDTRVQELPVIKPIVEKQKPVDVTEKRKASIIEGLATDSAESRSKIAEFLLFNLRGIRANQGLSTTDFDSVEELNDSLLSMPVLKVEEDVSVNMNIDREGNIKRDTVPWSKIVAIPLPGLKIAGQTAEMNLEIKYVPGPFDAGRFEVVGVKMASMVSEDKHGILKKIGSFLGKRSK